MSRETSLSGDERGETSAVRMLLAWHGLQFTFTFTVPYFSIGSLRSRALL